MKSAEVKIIDREAEDDSVLPVRYEISSYGADYDAEGLVKRLQRGDVYIPPFQREYVWSIKEASRFIESLLLGLPVPGVFLAREQESKRTLVVDGQQRLKTLQFFYEGYFNPDPDSNRQRVFKLTNVQPSYEGLTYTTLSEDDRIALNDSIIHSTVIKQEEPEGDNSSIFHIFERLNAEGRKLTAQQIRVAVYNGPFMDLIRELNNFSTWREIVGKKQKTLKDEELVLRFFAFYFESEEYQRPLKDFLNKFIAGANARFDQELKERCEGLFTECVDLLHSSVGKKAFRPENSINAAVYDAVMFGLASRLESTGRPSDHEIKQSYDDLMSEDEFVQLYAKATSDTQNVKRRLSYAKTKFASQ